MQRLRCRVVSSKGICKQWVISIYSYCLDKILVMSNMACLADHRNIATVGSASWGAFRRLNLFRAFADTTSQTLMVLDNKSWIVHLSATVTLRAVIGMIHKKKCCSVV